LRSTASIAEAAIDPSSRTRCFAFFAAARLTGGFVAMAYLSTFLSAAITYRLNGPGRRGRLVGYCWQYSGCSKQVS
jgi:hypothetical protein